MTDPAQELKQASLAVRVLLALAATLTMCLYAASMAVLALPVLLFVAARAVVRLAPTLPPVPVERLAAVVARPPKLAYARTS
ncbi:MAG TPA: hypothetical protein VK420_17500 [Longimicrobium sp.]|jgi:hypothetical protein|nr:hypothetical protein [Longimicrobium sp.]